MSTLDDPRITLAGLFFEAHAALLRATVGTLERHGISHQWFEAMLRLARSDQRRLRMSELAGAMTSITPSGLTRLVDRLEDEGLVRRERCPEDRRGAFAVLTDAGLEVVERVLPDHLDDLQRCYIDLIDPADRDRWEATLRTLRDVNQGTLTRR